MGKTKEIAYRILMEEWKERQELSNYERNLILNLKTKKHAIKKSRTEKRKDQSSNNRT